MANNVYIGMRYVPLFDGAWDNTKSYEALTIVEYGNNTYTSKKAVPVGTLPTDTTYWALTGNYNGQISNLYNLINTIQSGLNFNGKKLCVYGDSSVLRGSGESTYFDFIEEITDCDVTMRAVPGTKMNSGTNNGVSLINAATDIGTYDYVFLAYGINEWQSGFTPSTLITDVDAIVGAVRNKSLVPSIIFITPYYCYRNFNNSYPIGTNNQGYSLKRVNEIIIDELDSLKVPHIDFYNKSSCNDVTYATLLLNDSGGIYVHPSDKFKKELAQIVMNGFEVTEPRYYRSILGYDFYTARNRITNMDALPHADYGTGGVYSGICLQINANETLTSTHKLLRRNKYRIKGVCDHAFSLTFNSVSYNIASGAFDFMVDGGLIFTNIVLTSTANTILNDFDILELSNEVNMTDYRFGAGLLPSLTPATSVLEWGSQPKFFYDGADVYMTAMMLNIKNASSLTGNAEAFKLPDGLTIEGDYLIGRSYVSGSNQTCLLSVSGNSCNFVGAAPANGYYMFPSHTFKCGRVPAIGF